MVGGSATHGVTWADYDGDSRADLWVVDWATDLVTIYGDTVGEADRFTQVIAEATLGVDNGTVLLAGDYNRDRAVDAYVIDADGVSDHSRWQRRIPNSSGVGPDRCQADLEPVRSR